MSYHYLLDLALILLSTKVFGLLTQKIKMPQVVGALLAGLILGPSVLNVLRETEFLSQLSELGVIVILFAAGMGTDITELRRTGKAGFMVALCGVLVPLGMGFLLAWASWKLELVEETSLLSCVFVGTILTATSVSITVETLKELGRLSTSVGNTILAAALIDDVLGLIALTIVDSFAGSGESIIMVLAKILLFFAFAAAVWYVTSKLFDRMISHENGRNLHRYPLLAFVLCLAMAWCAQTFFGVSDIIGAFVAGLVVSSTSKASYIRSKIEPISYLLLSPIFYASIGISAQLSVSSWNMTIFSLLLLVVAIISKIIGCGLGAKLCGFSSHESFQVGVGMACRGEVALIVANKGVALGILSTSLMAPIIITVVGCAILTPAMLKAVFKEQPRPQESALADQVLEGEQLDIVSEKLLQENQRLMKKHDK